MMSQIDQNRQLQAYLDQDEFEIRNCKSGIEAILSHHSFINNVSNLYMNVHGSFIDGVHSQEVDKILEKSDPNVYYSFNSSALWTLLKDKISTMSTLQFFREKCDKTAIKIIMGYASLLYLNEAKQKIIEKSQEALRIDLKKYIQKKVAKQIHRKQSLIIELNKSKLFDSFCAKLKLSNKVIQQLKDSIVSFDFSKKSSVKYLLQQILSHFQRQIQKKQEHLQPKVTSLIDQVGEMSIRNAYGIILICNYLNIYTAIKDWLSIALKDKCKEIPSLLFWNISQKKGLKILQRVIDDAPLNSIGQQIFKLQNIFYK